MRLSSIGFLVLLGLVTLIVPSWFYSDLITTGILLTLLLSFIIIGSYLLITKIKYYPKIELANDLVEGTSINPPKISFKVEIPSFFLFDVFLRLNINIPYKLENKTRISPESEILQFTIFTPHRGEWLLDGVYFEIQDKLRLFSATVSVPIKTSVISRVPSVETRPLPILSSSIIPGDAYPLSTERLGEPFDLRPYQPGDSMKRILWKTFAKSGELITRQPEFSHAPEGEVLIFCAARKNDDYLAGLALKYAYEVEATGTKIRAGCLGSKETFETAESFELGLIGSSFKSDEASLVTELRDFIGDAAIVALFISNEVEKLVGISNLHIFLPSKSFKSFGESGFARFLFDSETQIIEEPTVELATVCRQAGFETTIVE